MPPLPRVRAALMRRYGAHPASELLDCPWCLSVHVGAALLALRLACPQLASAACVVLAASTVTGVITEAQDKINKP